MGVRGQGWVGEGDGEEGSGEGGRRLAEHALTVHMCVGEGEERGCGRETKGWSNVCGKGESVRGMWEGTGESSVDGDRGLAEPLLAVHKCGREARKGGGGRTGVWQEHEQ